MNDDCIEPLYSDTTRQPDMELAVPGRPFPGGLVNPVFGPRVLLDPLSGTTNAGQDTLLLFRKRAHHLLVQNNTNVNVYVDFDVPANPGSLLLQAGAVITIDSPCDELHLYTLTAQPYNNTTGGAIVVRAWL